MALTNRQIERYSRQLIVPDFGGVAQERLLAARILLIGHHTDAETVLAYLVGAGVGQIDLRTDLDAASNAALVARMRDLSPDSSVRVGSRIAQEFGDLNLALVLARDNVILDQARELCDRLDEFGRTVAFDFPIILARLDLPSRIAVIPRRPPCPRCASVGDLLGPVAVCADNAGFIAMLAALEAIKLLARFAPATKPSLIEFRGYEASARLIESVPRSNCACNTLRISK